ncbi:MAG: hypothetical protein E3J72_17955 [Planctomycetota bacterium]|nr:MAG: hypothetical protein E3J72_17955 [Planctomycetota bacterium]
MRFIISFLVFLLIAFFTTPDVFAQGITFEDEEEEYAGIDREELIELILELAGEDADIFCGRWLRIPIEKENYSPETARIARVMETRKISVNFRDTSLTEVFTFIADVTGLNIVVSSDLSEIDKTVNLQVKDLKVINVINLICDQAGDVSWKFRDDVLYIGTEDEVQEEKTNDFILIDLAEFLIRPPHFKGPDIKIFNPEE